MPARTETKREILMRCPESLTCSRKECAHNGIHHASIDCFVKTEGSIRPECCPDCRVEEK